MLTNSAENNTIWWPTITLWIFLPAFKKSRISLFKNFSSSRSIWNTGIALCTFPANETALEQWRIIIVKIRIPSVSYKLPETIS